MTTPSDPATEEAVREALDTVNNSPEAPWSVKHPKRRLFVEIGVVVLLVLGVITTTFTAINTFTERNNSQSLKNQNTCLKSLLVRFQKEANVRATIATDDRATIDIFLKRVFTQTDDPRTAYRKYLAARKTNEDRRKRLQFDIPKNLKDCTTKNLTQNPKNSSGSNSPSSGSNSSSASTSTTNHPEESGANSPSPKANGGVGQTSSVPHRPSTAPSSTHTAQPTSASPSSTPSPSPSPSPSSSKPIGVIPPLPTITIGVCLLRICIL